MNHESATPSRPESSPPTAAVGPSGPPLEVRLDLFDKRIGLDRGRPFWYEAIWYLVKCAFFLSALPWPMKFKRWLLIFFGAKVGTNLFIRPRVNIHMPWKLVIGDHCWIGEACEFLNFEPIILESHVALGHRVYLAAGNHDFTDHTMSYRNAPITIERGTWIGSCAFVGPGIVIGQHCFVAAGSVVTRTVPPWSVVAGNPAQVVKKRVLKR